MVSALVFFVSLASSSSAPLDAVASPTSAIKHIAASSTATNNAANVESTSGVRTSTDADLQPVDYEEENLGFVDKYVPFSLSPDLEHETQSVLVFFWVGMLLPFGSLWLPGVAAGDFPADYITDGIITLIVHMGIILVSVPTLICPPVFVVIAGLNGWYLTPVALANAYDRNLKRDKQDGSADVPRRKSLKPRQKQNENRVDSADPDGVVQMAY